MTMKRTHTPEALLAAREIVDFVGAGAGNLMYRFHTGEIYTADAGSWTEQDRQRVRGSSVFLLGGSIGANGFTSELLPLIARKQILSIRTHEAVGLAHTARILTPSVGSAEAGAFGAYLLALPPEAKLRVRDQAIAAYRAGRIPILPMLDVGGTKLCLIFAIVGQDGQLTFDILQCHRFATPTSAPADFYERVATALSVPLLGVARRGMFEVLRVLPMCQPGRFEHAKGEIGPGTARDLGPGFPGVNPSHLLQRALERRVGSFDVYVANDGRAQFLGIANDVARSRPEEWQALIGKAVVFLGLGTGLGAGFGQVTATGVDLSIMHSAFDILADKSWEALSESAFTQRPPMGLDYTYGELLSGAFFRRQMHAIDSGRPSDKRLFVPLSSLRYVPTAQVNALLGSRDDEAMSPLGAALVNDILEGSITTARVEEQVEWERNQSASSLENVLKAVAKELDDTLIENIDGSDYLEVIEQVRLAKQRRRRVLFLGIGKSHCIGRNLEYIFNNLGLDSGSIELTGANSENLTMVSSDDLVFVISYSGRAAELLQLIPYIHRKGARTVALTGELQSPLARNCTYKINTYVTTNPSPVAEAPTTSTTSALAAGTAIGIVVSYLVDFDSREFELSHPFLKVPFDGIKADASFDQTARIRDIFGRFAGAVRHVASSFREEFTDRMISLTKRILTSNLRERPVFLTGAGASLRVAEKVAATLTSIGIDAYALNPANLTHGDFAHVHRGDLLVIFTYSGSTRQLHTVHKIARSMGVDVVVVTAKRDAMQDSETLCIIAGSGSDDRGLAPVPDQKILSSFVNLTVGDALAVLLAEKLRTSEKDFAEIGHRGGFHARRQQRLDREMLRTLGRDEAAVIAGDQARLAEINARLAVPITASDLAAYEERARSAAGGSREVVIIGMGAVGLAYLGPLLHAEGNAITFVDSEHERIAAMRSAGHQYCVRPSDVSDASRRHQTVGRISAIAATDEASILTASLRADTIFTAVGVSNLRGLLPLFARVVRMRHQFWIEAPLNILCSENFPVAPDPLETFRHELRELLDDQELKVYFDELVGVAPAIDEAVIPEVPASAIGAPICIEPEPSPIYIDLEHWKRPFGNEAAPELGERAVFVPAFLPLHMRKLWMHNMAHCLIAYLGHYAGYTTVFDAVSDREIEGVVRKAMNAVGRELYRRWRFPVSQHPDLASYVEWRLDRYRNEPLGDTITRVCREPLRKLAPNDRLVGAINFIAKYALHDAVAPSVHEILLGLVAAMRYAVDTRAYADGYAALRSGVLSGLNVDSSLLANAEEAFERFRHEHSTLSQFTGAAGPVT